MEKLEQLSEKSTILVSQRQISRVQSAILDTFLTQVCDFGVQLIHSISDLDTDHEKLYLCGTLTESQVKIALNNAKSLRYKTYLIQDLSYSKDNNIPNLLQYAKSKNIGLVHSTTLLSKIGKFTSAENNNLEPKSSQKDPNIITHNDSFSTIEELLSELPIIKTTEVNETNSDIYGRVNEGTKTYLQGIDDVVVLDHFYSSPNQPSVTARNFIQTILAMNNLFLMRCAESKLKLHVHNNMGGHAACGGEFTLDQIVMNFGTEQQKQEYLYRLENFKKSNKIISSS